jgi:hypothetical protein
VEQKLLCLEVPSRFIDAMTFDDHARRLVQELFETASDRLVSDLSAAAQEEVAAAAARARHEAEQAGKAELAAVRSEGEARLASAQAMNTGLLESIEAVRQELATVRSEAEADIDRARQEAQGEVERALRAAQTDVERVRQELEEEVERLQQERAKILLARDEGARRLEAETRRANDLAGRLDTTNRDREAVFDRIATAVRSIDRATTPAEILETLLEPLGHDFARAAVFMVAPSSLKGWRARGLDPTIDITKLVIPRNNESLVARAVTERKRLIAVADGTPVIGMSGNPVPRAVALPVLAGDQVIAVAYAEDLDESSTAAGFPRVGCKIAEMLIDHASLRLTAKGGPPSKQASSSPAFTPERQAKRVRPDDGIDLVVDGAASSLVDVSNIGAQFVSPQAMRPNRVLRMQLRSGEYSLSCKGRVMWARFEPAKGADAAHYRVGVRFTDVDAKTVDEFLAGQGAAQAAS